MKSEADARSLSQEQQELLRRKVVEMVLSGKKQVEVAQLFGIHKDTVSPWVRKARPSSR